MKRVYVLLASALLLLAGSAVRADEHGTPGTLVISSAPATVQGCSSGCTASPGCASTPCCNAAPCSAAHACNQECGGREGRFLDWLCYKPANCHACGCHVSNCWPPLYTWFTDMCQGGGCGHGARGCPCGHAAPSTAGYASGGCATGGCATGGCANGGCAH